VIGMVARALTVSVLVFACWDEDRLGDRQHEPRNDGETYHDRKYDFYHGVERRFHASLLLLVSSLVLGVLSALHRRPEGCVIDGLLLAVGGISTVDAFMTMALGFT